MHPQSELENYKLQVELLQEKLHRSEDNRHELEKKLEQIMKKRNEHERTLRSRSQLKYQQFLDEQKKRNERNRKLVEMLERIDQQAAALSARSERLKMMKLQYELYFSKLVQSYATKTFQSIPALPLQRSSNLSTALRPDDGTMPTDALQMPSSNMLFNNTPQFQRVPIPMVVPISNEQNRCQPSWTFASAPPGVLIALPNNTTLPMSTPMDNIENKKIQSNFCFDYSQFPIGYLQAGTSSTVPMQYVGQASFLQQPHHQQKPSAERHTEQLFAADDDINQSKPHFEFGLKTPSSIPFSDVKTNETISNRTQSNQLISEERVCGNKTKKNYDLGFNEDKQNGQKSQNFEQTEIPMFNKDFPVSHQSLKVDKLPNIKLNNSFKKQDSTHGNDDDDDDRRRNVHEGNIPNTIDFRTDDFNDNNDDNNKYIKYIKEMEETYDYDNEKRVPVPISLTPRELNIDNITTTLQVQKIQKIDKPNIGDDEKINDMDDNEKNTSSASSSAPLNGKCSIESIGDEALTFAKNKPKTQEQKHISNTASARNIDPNRDTEQITLFNGTKNSKDESTRASNRTTAIIDGDVGENKETRMDPNADINSSPNPNPSTNNTNSYRPVHFDKKEKMSIENIETAIYGELLTKPENLTSSDIVLPSQSLDNPKGNGEEYKEIEQNSQKTMGYEFTNFEKDSYEHEQDPATAMAMGREQQHQVAPYATDIEQIEAKHVETVAENKPEDYSYGDVGSVEQQQYDMQNYNYSDPNAVMQENVPQQEYNYNGEAQVPGGENYPSDYQNYDPSQYPADYDPNAYQYDYSQGQYDENNQSQYAPEGYNQEYQQDPYATGEYGNYEQVGSNEGESGQLYNEADYTAGVQDPAGNQIEENYVPQQEAFGTEGGDMQGFQNAAESYEEQTEPEVEPSVDSGARPNQPTSILATDKNSDLASKKKKRVNFVDSETDESSTVQKPPAGGVSSESDFDFSTS